MTRRSLLLATALAALLVAGLAAFLLTPPPDGITRANCARIKPGITLAEVEAIFGGPADEGPIAIAASRLGYGKRECYCWEENACRAVIYFGNDDRVTDATFDPPKMRERIEQAWWIWKLKNGW